MSTRAGPIYGTYIPYDVPVREGGVRARLVLPADLSETEADRLCAFIRAVAFPDDVLAAAAKAAS